MGTTSRAEKRYLRRLDKELNKLIQCDPALSRAAARMSGAPKQGRVEAFLTYCDNSRYPFLWSSAGVALGLGSLYGAWNILMWAVNSGLRD